MSKKILVDGHNLFFRVFYGMQRDVFHADGRSMKCPVGFVSSLMKLIGTLETDELFVFFDSETSIGSRLEIYSEYKQNRIDYTTLTDEENPFTYLPDVIEALKVLKIPYVLADGYEADDYIATVCHHNESDDLIIVSTDTDFFQLVNEKVSVYRPKGKKSEWVTHENLYEKIGVYAHQVIEHKSLTGDTADNIPGIRGIGPKRASEILAYGSIKDILSGNTPCPEKYTTKIEANTEILKRNVQLITMNTQVPFSLKSKHLKVTFEDGFKAYDIIKML